MKEERLYSIGVEVTRYELRDTRYELRGARYLFTCLRVSLSACFPVYFLLSTLLIAYSANAVIVNDGLTPGLAGMIEPSMTYIPS